MAALYKMTVAKIKNAKPGKYGDGGGLWLNKRSDGGAQWFFRFTLHGRRHEMGLGALRYVSLKEARDTADHWRSVVRAGVDPIKERERRAREADRDSNTLAQVAADAFEARKAELKGDGKAGRWFSPLELHVLPKLGRTPIEEIGQQDVRNVLQPIWHEKAETARKAINRLKIVFQHGLAMGLRVDIQAIENAKVLLGKSRQTSRNIPALPWRDVPSFYATLSDGSITHLALRLLILTATRSRPIRFCHLDEIEGAVWTIPAANMKARKDKATDFRVPLSAEALAVIDAARPHAKDGFLFPSVRKGVISDATMARYMERLGLEARPHGFRSSFRDWCAVASDVPREVAEKALGHAVGNKVELAYRRTDFLEKRAVLMERWSQHVLGREAVLLNLMPKNRMRIT